MKTRTIVGVTAIPLFLLLILFAPLWGYAIVVGLICAGCSWEFLRCVDPNMNVRFKVYALAVGFEGHGEHPIPHWLRPVIFAIGAFLIWPTGRLSQIAAVVALVAVMILAAKLAPKREYAVPVEAE